MTLNTLIPPPPPSKYYLSLILAVYSYGKNVLMTHSAKFNRYQRGKKSTNNAIICKFEISIVKAMSRLRKGVYKISFSFKD